MVKVTLGEGNTPLVQSVGIAAELGLKRLFFKLENTNPSGSYKDRFAAAEVADVLASGGKGCLATSSGNTGSALAAFCARYSLPCIIVVGTNTPLGKLVQMQAHGARVLRIRDFLNSPSVAKQAFETLTEVAAELGLRLVVSAYRYSPKGMQGVEPLSGELLQQSSAAIRHVFVPVGGGGLFTAVCRGFEAQSATPFVHCVQPEGCLTVVAAFERGTDKIEPVESTTHVSGLSVPYDIDASLALSQLRKFGGRAFRVSDDEVLDAQQMLLRKEGIYAEPAGATALAGLRRALADKAVAPEETTICLVTGHGSKDPDSILMAAAKTPVATLEVQDLKTTISGLVK
jgi:threonine synthase